MSKADNSVDGERESPPESDRPAHHRDQPANRALPLLLAVPSLLLALLALAAAVWLWTQQPRLEAEALVTTDVLDSVESGLQADLDGQQERIDELAAKLDERARQLEELAGALADLRQGGRQRDEDVGAMQRRLADLEVELTEAVEMLERAGGERRLADRELERRLRLLEAASLLRSGQERAELAGDHAAARVTFASAYRLLRELDDPRLNRARTLVAQELEALESMTEPDWAAMSGRLSRLSESVDRWPGLAMDPPEEALENEVEAESPGWWARLGQTLARLVRVRPRDTVPVTAGEVDAAREQVRLRLAAADLALARRDLEALTRHLDAGAGLVRRWFDTGDEAVARALEQFEQLAATEPAALPALGAALSEIGRQLDDS